MNKKQSKHSYRADDELHRRPPVALSVTFTLHARRAWAFTEAERTEQTETLRLLANAWAEYIAATYEGDTATSLSLEDWRVEVLKIQENV